MKRRVAVTGLGAVSAAGTGAKTLWQALRDGRPGIGRIPPFTADADDGHLAAQVPDFRARDFMRAKTAATLARFAQLGIAAARLAHEDAGGASLPSPRLGACFGTSTSAIRELQGAIEQHAVDPRAFSPSPVLDSIGTALTNHVAVELEVRGPTMTLGSGCASGVDVIQWACEQIGSGASRGRAGGRRATPRSRAASTPPGPPSVCCRGGPGPPAQALRPFDALSRRDRLRRGRRSVSCSEDLEHARARGARVYAEVLGYGSGSDGLHLRPGSETSASLQTAMRRAPSGGSAGTARHRPRQHPRGRRAGERPRRELDLPHGVRPACVQPDGHVDQADDRPALRGRRLPPGRRRLLRPGDQFVAPTMNLDIPAPGCDLDYVPDAAAWRE